MKTDGFTTSFTVEQTPEEVFAAINNVRGWWSGKVTGETNKPGAEFTYRYKDMHKSTQRVTEFVPGKKVVWHVTDAELTFVKDKTEWIGTDIVFQITRKDGATDSALRIWAWFQDSSAMAAALAPGARWWKATCAN